MAYEILARDGRPVMKDGVAVKAMDLVVEKIEQLDEGQKSFIAVASTEDEDRDKDIIRQDGWDLKNFKKNPVVPWSHNYWGIPVAKSLKTWVDKTSKKLMFKPQFDVDDDDSMKIFNKYRKGFLKSFSVGFKGIEFEYRDEDNPWWGGIEFLAQELLEISGVTVPANPNATVSLHGGDVVQNLLQLGYPVKFAETKQGLFYPVREELGEFVNPAIKQLQNKKGEDIHGIQVVYADFISELKEDGSSGEAVSVGYYFDPEKWSTAQIKSWINGLSDRTYKFHYYNWEWADDEEKDFQIELKEDEKEIPDFDEPIKLLKKTDDDSDDDSDDKSIDDDSDDKSTDDDSDDNVSDTEKLLLEHLEKMTDLFGKHLDAITKGVEKAFGKVFDGLLEIKSLLDEEADSKSDDSLTPDKGNKGDSKSDDDIELDDSLLSPDNDKTNDDDSIELDDDLLSNKDNVKTAVESVFSAKLKETLKEVRDSFKIEV